MNIYSLLLVPIMLFNIAGVAYAGKVDINTATAKELEENLEGIGPVKAKSIVDYRKKNGKFKTQDDFLNVPGIGEATLQKNKTNLTLKPVRGKQMSKTEKSKTAKKAKTKNQESKKSSTKKSTKKQDDTKKVKKTASKDKSKAKQKAKSKDKPKAKKKAKSKDKQKSKNKEKSKAKKKATGKK